MATSSPSSPSPQQLSSTLPLDLTSPVRIVQKQVLQVRGHARGCTVALFMRLALPTSSSKSRSFPLFPDEGVKLKSSAVYPVAMAKGGRSTVIPPNASNGLKRAAQALALATSTAGEEQRTVTTTTTSKQVKPRITSANFHITLVCPPLPDGGAAAADRPSPSAKSHYVAVVQLEVALALSPPRWPFEARIPIPRCLNNKLQFLTTDDDDEENGDSDTADRFTVEFEPPLVQRPRPRKGDMSGDASMMTTLDSESSAVNDDVGDDCAASGPFPSSELMVARWAYAQAGASKVHGDGPALSAGRYPVLATALQSDAQILHVERCDDDDDIDGRGGGIWASLRVHLTLHDFHYAGLDKTAALYLTIKGGGHWQPETLSVRSERAKLLHSWSIDGRQEALMSRSSSVSTLAQTAVLSTSVDATPSLVINGSSMLFDSSLSDDTSNLIDTQPPKGVADVSVDGALDDTDMASTPTTSVSTIPPRPVRRPSAASLHSMASEYSQKSSAVEHGVLCLLLRTAALRDAANESEHLSFTVQGRMRMQASPHVDADGTAVRFSCPFVVATHVETRATLCSVSDEAVVMDSSTGLAMGTPIEIGRSSDFEVVSAVKSESNGLLEDSVDISSSTVAPQRSFALQDQTLLRSSDESLSLASLVPQQSAPQNDVASWMGIVEEASVKVWISNDGARGNRRAVNRLRMTWPRAWPGVRRATSSSASALLPTLVVTLPRLCEQERIEVQHASIHGEQLSVVSDSSKDDVALSATTSEDATSTSVQFRMPDGLYGVAEGDVYVVLLYSVEGGERDAPHCLFAPVASTLNYLHVELFEEAIKDDGVVAVARFSDQPAASSSLRVDKRMGTAVLDACALPAMSKVTLEYVAQTTALVPLDVVEGAPVRRHSLAAAAEAKGSDNLAAARLEPKLPSRPTRLSWTMIVLTAQSLALAGLLLHVSLTVLPATHVATHKIDRIAEALDLDVGAAAWQGTYRWAKQPQAGAEYDANDRSLVVKQHTELATVDPPLLRVAAAWLSLVLTWPYRVVSLLLRR